MVALKKTLRVLTSLIFLLSSLIPTYAFAAEEPDSPKSSESSAEQQAPQTRLEAIKAKARTVYNVNQNLRYAMNYYAQDLQAKAAGKQARHAGSTWPSA